MSFRVPYGGIHGREYPSDEGTVHEMAVEGSRSANSRSTIHAATEGVGSGRMSSDATLVSRTDMEPLRGVIRRLAHRAAGGKLQIDAANGRETLAGERSEIPGTGVVAGYDITQDDAHFLLHRTVILGGAHGRPRCGAGALFGGKSSTRSRRAPATPPSKLWVPLSLRERGGGGGAGRVRRDPVEAM